MNSRTIGTSLVALMLSVAVPAGLRAGEGDFQNASSLADFNASPRCPVKRFASLESLVPLPVTFDPFDEFLKILCSVRVTDGADRVKKAKGIWRSEVMVFDWATAQFRVFSLETGKFKTDSNGFDDFEFDIPTEFFADGFESGDVSAWSYTRSDFTNKKKATRGVLGCAVSTSSSGQ